MLGVGEAAFRFQDAALSALLAPVWLMAVGTVTIRDDGLASAVAALARNEFGYRAYTPSYITSI
ncbi:hypothetical protein [Roseiflexus sp.]|uniref:hypothetical protein n=1 Tax=Roseiflexus sp. TaxID=2562120 RepID=UPI00398B27EA